MNDCQKCPSKDPCFAKERNLRGEMICKALQDVYPAGQCPFQRAKREYKVPRSNILKAYEKVAAGRKRVPGTRDEDLRDKYDRMLQPLRKMAIKKYEITAE